MDARTIEHARRLAREALEGGRRLRRSELLAIWDGAGLLTVKQSGYYLIYHLAQTGTLCYGPTRPGEQLVVLLDEWVAQPRGLDREEALGEWVRRYFRSHGPATIKDFAWWTKLLAADVRTGLAIARPRTDRGRRRRILHGLRYAGPTADLSQQSPRRVLAARLR